MQPAALRKAGQGKVSPYSGKFTPKRTVIFKTQPLIFPGNQNTAKLTQQGARITFPLPCPELKLTRNTASGQLELFKKIIFHVQNLKNRRLKQCSIQREDKRGGGYQLPLGSLLPQH